MSLTYDTGYPTPRERFRGAVRKVIHMHRASTVLSRRGTLIGAEPGIDPRRQSAFMLYGHLQRDCQIEITDYSKTNLRAKRMDNEDFVDWLRDPVESARHPWVKVRWINVSGISWDVTSALAMKYSLHPLALEDILSQRKTAASKANYYPNHLFLRILRHTVGDDSEPEQITAKPRSSSPIPIADDKSKRTVISQVRPLDEGLNGQEPRVSADTEGLRKGGVNVNIQPVFICLFRDGTVISITPDLNLGFTGAISERLRLLDGVLRTSSDGSVLVEGLIDLIVDKAMEVVEEYQGRILKLERQVLIRPKMKTVRYLHIMSGDLILHKRTLTPIRSLIYGLRRYDVDRCAALADPFSEQSVPAKNNQGYLSSTAKTYLADVMDHMEYILASLDMFDHVAENLIDCTFNMASGDMSQTMRRLMLVTVIMLPLTFISGYFVRSIQPSSGSLVLNRFRG
ncbi:hypothetical protein NEOLEDRAFT_868956 [Neolentinus lepideus HHB14362 ss-1]|uniref:Cora-domain-containing protein n=1 Tax=Neolentinus lepideus HHB14362 ss-1 TaxID=1314782 RepID=A0A165P3G3_9AGAM|nr:hypothetical protein NEOLEDRAFT_868956 [Neolentinus lepideus HHB14362 ss-1]